MPMRGELPVRAERIHDRTAAAEPARLVPDFDGADLTVVLSICVIGLSVTLLTLTFFPDFSTVTALLDQFP